MEKIAVEVSLPKRLYEQIRKLVDEGAYSTFSEAVRSLIREGLKNSA